ncbi:MAG TPA: aminotransferase class V-fold PLP-dependent enzyme [Cellvibrionaceae bacterium]
MQPVYLDYAATTPVAPEAAAAMAECLTLEGNFANPASRSHIYGWRAEEAVEMARGQLASLIGCDAREIVWTSGATEANNLALKGVLEAMAFNGELLVSAIEHKAVLDPAAWLAGRGVEVSYLAPDEYGQISAASVREKITPATKLVSVMLVNNELGTINPIAAIANVCREYGCLLHVDAAQAVGKIPVNVQTLGVDLMSFSAHKMYGPKGIGALYVKRDGAVKVAAQIHGGGHERNMRSGTLPTHQCVGFGVAAELAEGTMAEDKTRIRQLTEQLWSGICHLPGIRLNGHPHERSAGFLNVCFGRVDGEMLLLSLRELAVSTGSACASASLSPSYVLKAIGLSDEQAQASIRFSVGRYTTPADIERAVGHITDVTAKLYAMAG